VPKLCLDYRRSCGNPYVQLVTLITRDGTKLRVRLYGIDAPEVRHGKKPGQPFGEEAKRALAEKVLRKDVTLKVNPRKLASQIAYSNVSCALCPPLPKKGTIQLLYTPCYPCCRLNNCWIYLI
jgi:hypothetical protein